MKTHSRRKPGRGLLKIHSSHLKVFRRTEGLIQLPTWINRIISRVIRQLPPRVVLATLQKSLCWELPIDSKIALVPLVAPRLSTRSVLVIRKSRVFKSWWQRACLPRNEDHPILSHFKRLRRRNLDFPDCPKAKGEAIRCKKTVKIIVFWTSKKKGLAPQCLFRRTYLWFRVSHKKRHISNKKILGSSLSSQKKFSMPLT